MKLRLSLLFLLFSNLIFSQSFHDTQGKLEISGSGQAVYTLPIAMPPSIQGVGPTINLNYASGQSGGIAGQGWSISSIPSISLMSTRRDIDGYMDGADYDADDKLAFDGQRMLLKTGTYWAAGSTYETETQSNTKIELVGTGSSLHFIVTSPDGSRSWFGNYGGQYAKDFTSYYIVRHEDTNGNFITYDYIRPYNRGLCISQINFSANTISNTTPLNKIVFTYKPIVRKEAAFIGGFKVEKAELLDKIEVFTNNSLFKKYQLTHETDPQLGYQRVSQLQEFNGVGEAANPVIFEYNTTTSTNWIAEPMTPYDGALNPNAGMYPGDYDGDGYVDLINGNFLFTKLFQGSTVNAIANANGTIPITTLSLDGKLNQFNSFLGVSNVQLYQTTFNIRQLNTSTNTIYTSYTKTVDFPNYGSCYSDCPNYTCAEDFFVTNSNKYYEGDFNGDGISELLMLYFPEHKQYSYTPPPSELGKAAGTEASITDPMTNCTYSHTVYSDSPMTVRLLDLNPNSSTELGSKGFVQLNYHMSGKIYVADFNGDGKSDIMSIRADKSYDVFSFKQLTVAPWVELEIMGSGELDHYATNKPMLLGDFNGDSKTDIIIPVARKSPYWAVYYSNPKQLGSNISDLFDKESHAITDYNPDTGAPGTPGAEFVTHEQFNNYYALDVNKDGKSDLVKFVVDYTKKEWWQYHNFDTKWKVISYVNNIGNTDSSSTFTFDYTSLVEHNSGDPSIPIPLASNFRANGLSSDFVVLRGAYGGAPAHAVHTIFTKDFTKDYTLKKVTQSGGAIVDEITYQPMLPTSGGDLGSLSDFYSSGDAMYYPFVEVKKLPTNRLVSTLKNTVMGVVKMQDFKYHGFTVNMNGLGVVGFRKSARSSWYTSSSTKRMWSATELDPLFRGATVRNYSQLLSTPFSFLTSYSSGIFNKVESTYIQNTDSATKRYSILLDKQTSTDYLTNVVTEKTYEYDPVYLAPTKVTNKNFLGATLQGTSISETFYNDDPNGTGANYFIRRPYEVKNTLQAYGDTKSSTEKYTYSNNVVVKTEKNANNAPETIVEDLEYFPNGNLKKKTISAVGTNPLSGRSTEYTYDPTNRFVKTLKDTEGLITTNDTYDPLYGLVMSQTNSFGQTTASLYDNWGKRTKVTDFLGKSVIYGYTKSGTTYTTTETGSDGTVSSMVESDALARVIRKGGKDINGNWNYVATQYDNFGRKYKESEPYPSAGSASQWTVSEFDDYDRTIKVTSPTGRVATMVYTGLTSTTYDEMLIKTVVKNANGHVVSSTDNPGGTITYTYNAAGNLLNSNYDGIVLPMTYDEWGRKLSLNDPSAGLYSYTYNAFGEILTETTPKGITTYTYYPTGKVWTKLIKGHTPADGTDILSTYTYDPTYKWLTNLTVTNPNDGNSSYVYTYDTATKQLKKTVETTPQAVFTKELTFDGLGRVETETSTAAAHGKSTTKTTFNVYKNDQVWQVRDTNASGALLWQVDSTNARGQLTNATLGNGIAITNTYDQYGYFAQIKHDKTGTTPVNIMTLNTAFEPKKGNLTTRYSSLFDLKEDFSYDALDRLKTWTGGLFQNVLTLPFTSTVDGFTFVGGSTYGSVTNSSGKLKVVIKDIFAAAQRALAIPVAPNDQLNIKATISNKTGTPNVIVNAIMVETDPNDPTNFGEFNIGVVENGNFNANYIVSDFVPNPTLKLKFVVDEMSPEGSNGGGPIAPNATFYVDDLKIDKSTPNYQNYDDRGRITQNNIGTYNYNPSKPYQHATVIPVSADATTYYQTRGLNLNIDYTAFKSPIKIEETGIDSYSFGYNAMEQRSVMYYGSTHTDKLARPYHKYYSADGSMEIKFTLSDGAVEFTTYLGGDAYSAPMVVKSDGTVKNNFYLHRDYLGSIVAITNGTGGLVEKRHFDAWGNITKVQDGSGNNLTKLTFFERGYTGHEHLQSVGLINMNGRLYDPKLHRFLQPDNNVQDPYNTQNYNRYGYVLNNPLKFTDPSGESYVAAVAIGVGVAIASYIMHAVATEAPINFSGITQSFFIGVISSSFSFGIGTATATIANVFLKAGVQALAHGVTQGAMSEMQGGKFCTGFYSGAIASIASSIWAGGTTTETKFQSNNNMTSGHFVTDTTYHQGLGSYLGAEGSIGTIAFGTVMGGVGASLSGGNFWEGAVTGLVVSGLNHAMHDDDIDPPGKKKVTISKKPSIGMNFLNDFGNLGMNTAGTVYGTTELSINNNSVRNTASRKLSLLSGTKASIFNKGLRQTGRVLGKLGTGTGIVGGGIALVSAGNQVYNGTDNTAMWTDTSISTLLLIGTLVPSPLTPFCAVGSLIYGGVRLTAGDAIDSSINNNFGYR